MKSLSALLRGITSKQDGNFYYLNCFLNHIIQNKKQKKIEKYKSVSEYHGYVMYKYL